MQIVFVGEGGLDCLQMVDSAGKKNALTVVAFDGKEVCYERELKGETRIIEDIATFSKANQGFVVYGVITNTHGHRRKSAIVAENGRILGISDMCNAIDGEVRSGAFLRVYDAKIGRVGVVVAEDVYDMEMIKTLSFCGCDFIVCPFDKVQDSTCGVLLRAYAFLCGVPIVFCGRGYAMIADVDANLAFASPISPVGVEFHIKKEFHLLETRRRIYLKNKRTD